MRTGSVLPSFLAHAFCNTMGLPNPAGTAQWFPDKKLCTPLLQPDSRSLSCTGHLANSLFHPRSDLGLVRGWGRRVRVRLLAVDRTGPVRRKYLLDPLGWAWVT